MNKASRDCGYFVDGSLERSLIGTRRFVKATDFSYELKGSILNLFGGDGRIKVEKRLDVPTHSGDLSKAN